MTFENISDLSDSINKNLYNTYLYELTLLPAVTSIWTFKKKRKKKFINNPTILHPVCYDYIRYSLDNGDDIITDIFSHITNESYLRKQGLEYAVALLQLNQDRRNVRSQMGVWLDQILYGKTADQVISGDELHLLCKKFVERLLAFTIPPETPIDWNDLLNNRFDVEGLTVSELGVMLLYAKFPDDMDLKNDIDYIYPICINPYFVPICYLNTNKKFLRNNALIDNNCTFFSVEGNTYLMKQIMVSTMISNKVAALGIIVPRFRLVISAVHRKLCLKLYNIETTGFEKLKLSSDLQRLHCTYVSMYLSMVNNSDIPAHAMYFRVCKFRDFNRKIIFFLPPLPLHKKDDVRSLDYVNNTKLNYKLVHAIGQPQYDKILIIGQDMIIRGSNFIEYVLQV